MLFSTLRLLYLLVYLLIASQGMFYLLGIHKALSHISIGAFAEQRKAIDLVIATPLKVLYLGGLSIGLLTLLLYWKKYNTLAYATLVVAFALMVVDILLAFTQNLPINQQFHSYSAQDMDTDWAQLRAQWLYFICLRGGLAILGLAFLLWSWLYPNFLKSSV